MNTVNESSLGKRGLFNSLFISDIDLADGEGQRSFGVEVDQGPLKMWMEHCSALTRPGHIIICTNGLKELDKSQRNFAVPNRSSTPWKLEI